MQTNAILGNLLQNGLQNICCICFTESTEVLYTLDCALEDVSGKTMDFILKQKFAMDVKSFVDESFICYDCIGELVNVFKFHKKVEKAKGILNIYKQTKSSIETTFKEGDDGELMVVPLKNEENTDVDTDSDKTGEVLIMKRKPAKRSAITEFRPIDPDEVEFCNIDEEFEQQQKFESTKSDEILETIVETVEYSSDDGKMEENFIMDIEVLKRSPSQTSEVVEKEIIPLQSKPESKVSHSIVSCKICGDKMESPKIPAHRKYYHAEENPYQCVLQPDSCSMTFKTYRLLKLHNCLESNIQKEVKQFLTHPASSRRVYRKRNENEVERSFICPTCGKGYTNKFILEKHKESHSNLKPYVCPICGKGFSQSGGLYAHKLVHQKNYKFECDMCGKMYQRKENLKYHVRLHVNQRPYECTVCGKSFIKNSNLTSHFRSMHTSAEEKYKFKCEACPMKFITVSHLKLHIEKKHEEPKEFSCEICFKTFPHQLNLTRHKRTHLERKFDCLICNAQFTRKEKLKIHMRIHTNECPYQCTFCPDSFKDLEALKRHQRIHGIPYVRGRKTISMRKDKSVDESSS